MIKNAEPKSPHDWPNVCAKTPAPTMLRVNVKQDFGDFSFPFGKQEAPGKSCGHCTVSASFKGIHSRDEF